MTAKQKLFCFESLFESFQKLLAQMEVKFWTAGGARGIELETPKWLWSMF